MMVLSVTVSEAQSDKKKVAVLNIDTKGLNYDPGSMGNLVRLELEKLNLFEVVDRYDVEYLVKKKWARHQWLLWENMPCRNG